MTKSTSEHPHERNKSAKGSYALVNGLNMYYEIHGTGKPLVLLHGGLATIDMLFGQMLPPLAQTRQVIAVELQAHGHTSDIDRPLRYELMADDIAALLNHLGVAQADLFGYSLGGGVALQTVIRHPEVVRKLVVASAPYKHDGWYPEVLAGMASMDAEAMIGSPMHDAYVRAAPKPEDWPRFIIKFRRLLIGEPYDWAQDITAIRAPTLIVVGDADSVRLAHAVELFGLLGGGKVDGDMGNLPQAQFAVLAGTTHSSLLFRTDLLLSIIGPFLDAPLRVAE